MRFGHQNVTVITDLNPRASRARVPAGYEPELVLEQSPRKLNKAKLVCLTRDRVLDEPAHNGSDRDD